MPLLINLTKQSVIELSELPITIGRDASCKVSISDPLLSRAHAEISRTADGRYKIVDLGSTHGTYHSGQRISERVLVSGDEIVVGSTRFRFYENSAEYTGDLQASVDVPTRTVDPLQSYPYIETTWQNGADFLRSYKTDCDPGRFFYPIADNSAVASDATPGELLSLDIRFFDRNANFHVHVRLIGRQSGGDNPGLLLEFVKEERDRQELVLACAKGESIPYFRRRHERMPCRIPVMIDTNEQEQRSAIATDISEGGARVITSEGLDRGARVILHLSFPEKRRFLIPQKRRLALSAKVASTVAQGNQKSVGVEFLFESSEQRAALVDEIARLRSNQTK